MVSNKKIEKILTEAYTLAFEQSTPSAVFESLVDNASVNDRGEKEIPFNDYVLSEDKQDLILKSLKEKYNLSNVDFNKLKINYTLGCSPRYEPKN